ncbi:hypothetical protein BDR03DRAFT_1027574 [Suillus americanus]|nr:hypothetical protein BDR03DRAFT_1027574 [Suillus americanus]
MPMNAKYHSDVGKWVCTCPHFIKSWFLVCKHLVQDMHIVSPVFFLEVQFEGNMFDRENEEVEDGLVDTVARRMDTHTFQECFKAHIKNLRDFCDGLQYQIQFNNHRMLHAVECEGASFICLMENCLGQEKQENSSWQRSPTTWERETQQALINIRNPDILQTSFRKYFLF